MAAPLVRTGSHAPAVSGNTTVSWPMVVHEHDADMAEMLELEGQLLFQAGRAGFGPARSFMVAVTKRWAISSEASTSTRLAMRVLRIEMAPARIAAIRLFGSYRYEKLGPNRPAIPKLLQHAVKVSTAPSAPPDHALHARSYASSFLFS